jgi:uncharacterized coiled-coil DUF342 family protein
MEQYTLQFQELEKINEKKKELEQKKQETFEKREELFSKLNEIQSKKSETKENINNLLHELHEAILHSGGPKEITIYNYLKHEKKCPICKSDINNQINQRISSNMCLFCGESVLNIEFRDNDELKQEIDELKELDESLNKTMQRIEKEKREIEVKYQTVSEELIRTNQKKELLEKELKKYEGILKNKDTIAVMSAKIDEFQIQRETFEKKIEKHLPKIQDLEDDLKKLQEFRQANINKIREEADNCVLAIRNGFSKFIQIATNNELNCTLSEELIPALDGREIFAQDEVSQYEHILMDYAFRFAFLKVYSSLFNCNPFLVIETPDQIIDEALLPFFAKAMAEFAKDSYIIVTTTNSEFLESLKNNFEKHKIVNLVELGVPTQKTYYQKFLDEFMEVQVDVS